MFAYCWFVFLFVGRGCDFVCFAMNLFGVGYSLLLLLCVWVFLCFCLIVGLVTILGVGCYYGC